MFSLKAVQARGHTLYKQCTHLLARAIDTLDQVEPRVEVELAPEELRLQQAGQEGDACAGSQ